MDKPVTNADLQSLDQNPVPEGSRSFRASVDDSVHQKDTEMWKRARLFVRNITSRYVNYSHQATFIFNRDLRNLWYLLIGAAKITPTDEASADRLAIQVLIAREMGTLRPVWTVDTNERNDQPSATTTIPPPRLWTDLPFLVTDLQVAWIEALEPEIIPPPDQLANLAGFTARLVAFGICEAELSQCGLLLLRAALETARRVLEGDQSSGDTDIPLSYFMPALLAWFRHGSYKLFSLCARGHASNPEINAKADFEDRWVAAGPLLSDQEEGVLGFSMIRWEFWKRRLDDIANLQTSPSDETIQAHAKHCFGFLDSWEGITGGDKYDRELARKVYFDLE
jgi:hypothetical protein